MFGLKIIKEIEYNDLLIRIKNLQDKNKSLNDLINPPTGDTVVKKSNDIKTKYCMGCKHCLSYDLIGQFGKCETTIVEDSIVCDLDCKCENYERKDK